MRARPGSFPSEFSHPHSDVCGGTRERERDPASSCRGNPEGVRDTWIPEWASEPRTTSSRSRSLMQGLPDLLHNS